MKKYFLLLILIISTVSCERDDICIDPTTPNLILKFLDATDLSNTNSITGLELKILDLETDTIFTRSGDSISIPLRIDSNTTTYTLTNQIATDDIRTDTIVLNYQRNETFVGRSCGFKTTFENVTIESTTNNWIQTITTVGNLQNIENETTAHITISH